MSLSRAIARLLMVLAFGSAQAADLNASYAPTRAEWLKLVVHAAVHEQAATWQARVAVIVVVRPRDSAMDVVVTVANGTAEPPAAAKARYVESVRSIARSVLERYEWAKDIKLAVQFA